MRRKHGFDLNAEKTYRHIKVAKKMDGLVQTWTLLGRLITYFDITFE